MKFKLVFVLKIYLCHSGYFFTKRYIYLDYKLAILNTKAVIILSYGHSIWQTYLYAIFVFFCFLKRNIGMPCYEVSDKTLYSFSGPAQNVLIVLSFRNSYYRAKCSYTWIKSVAAFSVAPSQHLCCLVWLHNYLYYP